MKRVYYLANLNYNGELASNHNVSHLRPCGEDVQEEAIWYDFNDMRESSELKLSTWRYVITNMDYVDIMGKQRIRHSVTTNYGSFSVIEGVGSSGDFKLYADSEENHGDLLCRLPLYGNGMTTSYPIFFHLEDADGNIIYDAPNDPSGVSGIVEAKKTVDEAVEVARYDVHGRRLSKPVPGINIVRMSDGTVRKVIERKL